MALPFSSSGGDVIRRDNSTGDSPAAIPIGGATVEEMFEVDRCLKWATEKSLTRITLQFPDSLMAFAPKVSEWASQYFMNQVMSPQKVIYHSLIKPIKTTCVLKIDSSLNISPQRHHVTRFMTLARPFTTQGGRDPAKEVLVVVGQDVLRARRHVLRRGRLHS